MASYAEVHDRILDPYDKQMFGEDTRFSQHIFSRELNRFLGIVEDGCVLRGCEVIDYTADASSFQVQIDSGDLIHDNVYFQISDPTWITFYLYKHYSIVEVNQTYDYFSVSGNVSLLFKESDEFAVVGSTGNDAYGWVVSKTEYVSGTDRTKIYVTTDIPSAVANGSITYRVVDDSNTTAKLLCYTKFKYLKTTDEYDLQFCLDYMKNDGTVAHGWTDENRLILGIFDLEKNATDTEIVTPSFIQSSEWSIELYGITYNIRNITDIGPVDGGQL